MATKCLKHNNSLLKPLEHNNSVLKPLETDYSKICLRCFGIDGFSAFVLAPAVMSIPSFEWSYNNITKAQTNKLTHTTYVPQTYKHTNKQMH